MYAEVISDPAVPFLGIYLKQIKLLSQSAICTLLQHYSQQQRYENNLSVCWWIEKIWCEGGGGWRRVSTYSGISFSAKKEGNSAIYDNMMNLEDILLNEISHTHTKQYYMILLVCRIFLKIQN